MIQLILIVFFVLSVILGRYLYERWFNQISIYVFIWFIMLSLYEAKLMHYADLSFNTWVIVCGACISFIFGSVTYFVARKDQFSMQSRASLPNSGFEITQKKEKHIKWIIIITGTIGILGAFQHWNILLNSYGSFTNILISAQDIYRERVSGELKGVIPYLSAFSFVSVFFAGIYSAYNNKFSLLALLPILAVILKEIANVSRAGMLFGIIEFAVVIILFGYFYPKENSGGSNKKLGFGLIVIFLLIVASATLVRSVKGSVEHFQSSTRELNQLNENIIITPSIYLYLSAHVGVLNKYLAEDDEKTMIGENTFMPVYRVLSKFELVDKPKFYQKGYYIPMWTNTGTYLRELHADFGAIGVFLLPYIFGLFLSFIWYRLIREFNYITFVLLVYSFIIISFSFLVMISRLGNWLISLIVLLMFAPFFRNSKLEIVKK